MRSNIAHEKTIKLVDGQTVPQIRSCAILVLTDVLACKVCVVELFTSRPVGTEQLTVMSRPCDTSV